MYSRQMLCLVTARFAPQVAQRIDAARAQLDAALTQVRFVHFASLALLPGRPHGALPPTLLLELAIDDGIAPQDALTRLIDAALQPLWSLYFDSGAPDAHALHALLDPLLQGAGADGGFIGARDRTVAQVVAEQQWFEHARQAMRTLRDRARAAGVSAPPSLLVQQLAVAMAGAPQHVAMQSAPPRSFWCRPRAAPVQVLLALGWIGLPVPLLVVALASVGALFDAGVTWAPAGIAYLVLIASAAGMLLFAVFVLVGLVRWRALAMSVLLLALSALGLGVLYVLLVGNFLRAEEAAGHGAWFDGPDAVLRAAALLAVVVLAWSRLLRHGDVRTQRRVFGAGSALAAALVALMLGLTSFHLLKALYGAPWRWLHFALPAAAVAWCYRRSQVARWALALGWLVVPALLLLAAALSLVWGGALRVVWTPAQLLAYSLLGVLAQVAFALLLGTLLGAFALATVRSPWRPLGLPLLALTLLLAALSAGTGAIGVRVFESLGRPLPPPPAGWPGYLAYSLAFAFAFALAAAFVFGVRWLAEKALPGLAALERNYDRASPLADDFRPCVDHRSILANEASLAGRTNHLISLTDVRGPPGGWKAHLLRLWLHIIGQAGHVAYTRGFLGTAWGIHYAHWHVLDGGRLLFVSNFDGPFGGYLDAFIQGCSQGINLVWRWTELRPRRAAVPGEQPLVADGDQRRYPPTVGWAFLGCHMEQHFKAYARASLVPHLYLFQAYADVSSADIHRATRLREALAGERTPANDDRVMRTLES